MANNHASYTPDIPDSGITPVKAPYAPVGSFKFWAQKVLPALYDDSLSYYEVLTKLVWHINKMIEDMDNFNQSIENTNTAFGNLQTYVNATKDSLINAYNELQGYVNTYFDNLDVQDEINHKLDSMAVTGVLTSLVSPYIPGIVTAWLNEHVDPTTAPVVDDSLTISGAAADAKVTGDSINGLKADIKTSIRQLDGESFTGSLSESGREQYSCPIIKGHVYVLKNTSNSAGIAAWTQAIKGTNLQTITEGLLAGASKTFRATNDANYISVFGDGAFSFSLTDESSMDSLLKKTVRQINGESFSGSYESSGREQYEYPFLSGHIYMLENTSASAAIAAWTQINLGTNIETITGGTPSGSNVIFIANQDANYISVYGDGAFSFRISDISSVGYKFNSVQNEVHITKGSSGYLYIDYHFKPGHVYEFIGSYNGAVVVSTTNEKSDTATTIDSITSGATCPCVFDFVPSADASILRVFFNASGGNAIIKELGTISSDVQNIEESYYLISKRRIYETLSNSIIYYPVESGKQYRLSNISEVTGSGNYGVQAYTRATRNGSNVQTITTGLLPNNNIVFTASSDTKYIVLNVAGENNIKVSIDECNTLLDAYEHGGKGEYVSGQINFTVPVNQKRLYFTQGSGSSAQDNENDIVDVTCVCMLPTTYTPNGEKTKLLMICHGSGGGVSDGVWFRNDSTVLAFFQQFLNAGYAIFDCNGYANGSSGAESFGVDTAIMAYHEAYKHMVETYNVESELNIYGFSMGGLTALNYANMFPGGIKCIGLGAPLVSIYHTVWIDYTVPARGDVSTAYGFASISNYEADTVGNCDPYARIKTIGGEDYCYDPVPTIKIWHGSSDTTVPPTYSKDYADALLNAGKFCYFREVTGGGHEISYGGNATVIAEIIAFFNRYN